MSPLGWNHLLYYVHLDDRAKDLRTTTSPTQALSDECDKSSGFITAVKITALFRPGSNLSPRWKHWRLSRPSKPPADAWSKRGEMIATVASNATKTGHNNYTTNWNNWYPLNYLTLLRLLPTNEPTKRLNAPVVGINRNWHDFYATKNRDEVERTTTG